MFVARNLSNFPPSDTREERREERERRKERDRRPPMDGRNQIDMEAVLQSLIWNLGYFNGDSRDPQ